MKRRTPILAAAALLLGSLQTSPSVADDSGSAEIVNLVDREIPVLSNGSRYHLVPPTTAVRAYVRVRLDTGTAGKIKWYTTWLSLVTGVPDNPYWYPYRDKGHHRSFDPRPKSWDETVLVGIPSVSFKSLAITQCNALADRLRSQGLGNTAIFSQDREIGLGVDVGIDWEMSGPDGNPIVEGDFSYESIKIVCRKWDGPAIPQVADQIDSIPPVVEKASLTLLERSGLNGVCKVILSGVIETSVPDTKVRFRYKDDAGHQSEVHKVVTDHAGIAMFDHEYNVPDNPNGGENGKIRIVGVSHPFKSVKRSYNMDCTAPATDSFEALLPPLLEMQVVPTKRAMVGRQYCVTEVKAVGKILGRSDMSGEAMFIGDDRYLSRKQAYEVQKGDFVLLGADRELDWSQAALTLAGQPRSLTIELGFNVTGPANTVVAALPKKDYTFTCMIPSTDVQAGQSGFSPAQRPEPVPGGASTLRLVPQAGQPAVSATPRRPELKSREAGPPVAPARPKQRLRLGQ